MNEGIIVIVNHVAYYSDGGESLNTLNEVMEGTRKANSVSGVCCILAVKDGSNI